MDKISVVIPVYNVEPYLRQCLDSVINQTYRDLEIIIVDDGSPDNCGAICDEYAAKDGRVTVIHKENGGLTNAWNDGLRAAHGKWVTFVDSDDWLEPDHFENMLRCVGEEEPDILQAGGYLEEKDGERRTVMLLAEPFHFANGEGRDYLMARTLAFERRDGREFRNLVYVWTKLYKASFLRENALTFDPRIRAGLGCDALFNFQAFSAAKTVGGCMCVGYHYRRTAESGTLRFGPDRPEAVHYILECLHDHMEKTTSSETVDQAIDAYAILHLRGNLSRCFFHPENQKPYGVIAEEIRQMKRMPCYRHAIHAGRNPFLTYKKEALKLLLRTPFILPLKLLVNRTGGGKQL